MGLLVAGSGLAVGGLGLGPRLTFQNLGELYNVGAQLVSAFRTKYGLWDSQSASWG